MALSKKESYDAQILEDGQLQVRKITRIMEDGIELSKTYHRHAIDVGEDVSQENELIRDIANSVHTPARVAARRAFIATQESGNT